ncbi:transcriptional regulator with XRE-family HTH domain [Kitasatospora sp. MAA4]|uniref:helix-turn-helix domain-containing protein n=1 Tax=Kitasatospora sp. MAA4 TaxID=3035093 RepID=UPI0024764C97|nr:helix-turn-helix transcriptional regulator [Kitasatospora sp. MAA4]MDH6132227.1 transcriptional regulator with XRE-family HTH domain [Kitasatospora sp. MAA4]
MPSSPSSSAQAARVAVAARLRELMLDAGLPGQELAARCGWHPAKTSRILNAKAAPTDGDIRAWCTACGAEDQAADLIATARAVESMYMEWRRIQRNGMRRTQEKTYDLYERTAMMRVYVSNVMPGFFQTPAYATALMRSIRRFKGYPDDVADAVAARVARSRFLYEGGHRFAVVMEETVLKYRIGDAETMAGQLRHLLTVMPLPSVSIGIIPSSVPRTVWPLEAFYLFDDVHARVETLTAAIDVTQPREIADYAQAFAGLSKMAVHGDDARALVSAAITALG